MSNNTTRIADLFNAPSFKEDQTTEFKTSLFISPENSLPGLKQMKTIAESMAAFMNADGGMLYIGVRDDGTPCGIEKDLALLASQPASLAVHTVRYNDSGFEYGGTEDKYELKIRAIAKAFLSPNANQLIKGVKVASVLGHRVCRIECGACPRDEFVYSFHWFPSGGQETEEIMLRTGNQKTRLSGKARDDFIRKRTLAGFDAQLDALRVSVASSRNGTPDGDSVVSAVRDLLERLRSVNLPGAEVTVSGGQPFTEEAVKAARRPKALAWEGAHYAEVSGWQMLVMKLFEKLQETDAAKFDELADGKEFSKYLVKVLKTRERHGDCYPLKLGKNGSVRAKKSLGNKVYLYQEDKALRKIIAAFGVDVSKFMFVAD